MLSRFTSRAALSYLWLLNSSHVFADQLSPQSKTRLEQILNNEEFTRHAKSDPFWLPWLDYLWDLGSQLLDRIAEAIQSSPFAIKTVSSLSSALEKLLGGAVYVLYLCLILLLSLTLYRLYRFVAPIISKYLSNTEAIELSIVKSHSALDEPTLETLFMAGDFKGLLAAMRSLVRSILLSNSRGTTDRELLRAIDMNQGEAMAFKKIASLFERSAFGEAKVDAGEVIEVYQQLVSLGLVKSRAH